MNSQEQFTAFEFMCRARAELAKKEMNYWLAERRNGSNSEDSPNRSYKKGSHLTPATTNPNGRGVNRAQQDGSHGSSTNDFKG